MLLARRAVPQRRAARRRRVTRLARTPRLRVGFDLAHAIGNVPLALHDDAPDFAVWCSYKYLNAGPGAVGGCFVHRAPAEACGLPRFAGWWGHDVRGAS